MGFKEFPTFTITKLAEESNDAEYLTEEIQGVPELFTMSRSG
jgi:hypothetical protein